MVPLDRYRGFKLNDMVFTDRRFREFPFQRTWIGVIGCLCGWWISAGPLHAQHGVSSELNGGQQLAGDLKSDPVDPNLAAPTGDFPAGVDSTSRVEDPPPPADRAGSLDSLTAEQLATLINAQRESISADSQLSDEEKKSRLEMLNQAQEWVHKTNLYETEKIEFENRLASYPAEIEASRKLLNNVISSEDPPVTSQVDSELLHRQLIKKRQLLEKSKASLETHELESKEYQERLTVVPRLRAEANDRLKLTKQTIEKIENETQDEADQLSLILLYSKRLASQKQVKMLDAEAELQELTGKFLPIQHDLIARRISQLELEIKKWEVELKKVRELETQREAEEARLATANVDPALKSLAVRNEELVAARKKMHDDLQILATELSKVQSDIEALQDRFGSLKDKIDAAGLTKANGMLLVELRRNLAPTGASQLRIGQIEDDLQRFNLQVVQLTEERAELHDPVAYIKAQIERDDSDNPLLRLGLDFIDSKREYLDQLVADNQEYLKLLQNAGVKHQQLIDQTHQVRTYIDKNALWIRSAHPISFSDYSPTVLGVVAFCDPQQWGAAVRQVRNRMGNRPYETAIATIGLFLLFVFTRRLKISLKS